MNLKNLVLAAVVASSCAVYAMETEGVKPPTPPSETTVTTTTTPAPKAGWLSKCPAPKWMKSYTKSAYKAVANGAGTAKDFVVDLPQTAWNNKTITAVVSATALVIGYFVYQYYKQPEAPKKSK